VLDLKKQYEGVVSPLPKIIDGLKSQVQNVALKVLFSFDSGLKDISLNKTTNRSCNLNDLILKVDQMDKGCQISNSFEGFSGL
jgi:hypothetical protein